MGNETYDVIVAGGGIAGVSAAVSAAKKGAKTLLLEKSCSVGGLAASGLINIFLPLCDGSGHQVTFGLTYELMKRSMIYGPGKVPEDWREKKNAPEVERLRCVFSPASLILALEEFLLENGVEIRYDSLVAGMEKEGKLVRSLHVEDSDGRKTLEGKAFVDATGAAVLSKMAAEEVSFGKNVLSLWALEYEGSCQYGRDRMAPDINMLTRGNAERTFTCPSAKDATDYILETRALLRKVYLQEYASGKTDRFRRWPLFLPGMPQFRKIAALKGKKELSDNMNNLFFEDSIGVVSDWRKSGPVWEIPFGTLQDSVAHGSKGRMEWHFTTGENAGLRVKGRETEFKNGAEDFYSEARIGDSDYTMWACDMSPAWEDKEKNYVDNPYFEK